MTTPLYRMIAWLISIVALSCGFGLFLLAAFFAMDHGFSRFTILGMALFYQLGPLAAKIIRTIYGEGEVG